MYLRVLWGLMKAPLHGFMVGLAIVPLTAVGAGLIGGIGYVAGVDIENVRNLALISFLLFLLLLLLAVIVTAQTARYAGSFAGAIPLSEQVGFRRAFLRTFVISILFGLVTVAIGFGVALAAIRLQIDIGLPLTDPAALQRWEETAISDMIAGRQSTEAVVYKISFMIYTVFYALFVVPAACGTGSPYGRAWSLWYILFRFLVSLPVIGIATDLLASGLGTVIVSFVPAGPDLQFAAPVVYLFLQYWFFGSMAFAVEGAILAAAWEAEEAWIKKHETSEEKLQAGSLRGMLHDRMDRAG